MTQTAFSWQKITAREASYLALLASLKGEKFIADTLEDWRKAANPQPKDFHLAQQIATGSAQRALTLDFFAQQLAEHKKLSLKLKEKALLRTALYQYYFLDRIPLYAIANDSVALAKKYCHRIFANYLNAVLRKLPEQPQPNTPSGDSLEDLSIRYSYPSFFIKEIIQDYGSAKANQILEIGNHPSSTTLRVRCADQDSALPESLVWMEPQSYRVAQLKETAALPELAASPAFYIQNITPVCLLHGLLKEKTMNPNRILDLCAAPGGKLIALHDFFPEAHLHANDLTPEKIALLHENCQKYGLTAELTSGPGEQFTSPHSFDLIILDVPCSNTGVLNKRAEARWRLTETAIKELEDKQLELIKNAKKLLSPKGELWFMTCSILKRENEQLAARASQLFGLEIRHQQTIVPNREGWDGGYACAFTLPTRKILHSE